MRLNDAMAEHQIDPVILDAVEHVANRFGVSGLRDLISEAQRELADAEAALTQLADLDAE